MNDGLAALSLLASGLAGVDAEVQPFPGDRPVLAGKRLLLPDGAASDHLRRAMVAHAVAHLRHSAPARPAGALKPMGIAVASAIEDARVERLLCRDFPGVHGWFTAFLAPVPDARDLGFHALISRMDRVLMLPAWQDDNHWVNKARRLFEQTVAHAGLEDGAAFRAIASVLANDLGQMRVRFEPRDHTVPAPYRDDNSYLWDFGEARTPPDEAVALQHAGARPPPPSGAPNEGEAPRDGGQHPEPELEPELALGRYTYPEWDRTQERLRPDWCTVIETRPAWQGLQDLGEQPASPHDRVHARALPRTRHLDRARRLRRQWEGDDIDLNAAIEVRIDRRLGLRPDARLFTRAGRGPRPSSLLVLLDLSASANDAGAHGVSLLDIEKQAALLLAASALRGIDRLAIHGFSSNTRAEVYYCRLLDFGQPLDAAARATIGAVRGRYSTRMGAALRHATSLLRGEPEGRRAIVLVTDGAPSDIDVHDPKYLVEDARQAVAEARAAGVHAACMAVDGAADACVRRIFGWRNHGIADDARSLPARLARLGTRLGMLSPGRPG